MQIRKVKSSNGMILIRAEEQSGEDDIRRIELESRAEPRPEFHEAMGGLIGPAMRMIQAPLPWITVATISGVSITHEEECGMGAVVTILVPLECAPSPLVINTPYLTSLGADGYTTTLPYDLCQAVERVIDEAHRYLDGERAQADLFAERPDDVPVDKSNENGVVEKLEKLGATTFTVEDYELEGKRFSGTAAEFREALDALNEKTRQQQPVIKRLVVGEQ